MAVRRRKSSATDADTGAFPTQPVSASDTVPTRGAGRKRRVTVAASQTYSPTSDKVDAPQVEVTDLVLPDVTRPAGSKRVVRYVSGARVFTGTGRVSSARCGTDIAAFAARTGRTKVGEGQRRSLRNDDRSGASGRCSRLSRQEISFLQQGMRCKVRSGRRKIPPPKLQAGGDGAWASHDYSRALCSDAHPDCGVSTRLGERSGLRYERESRKGRGVRRAPR